MAKKPLRKIKTSVFSRGASFAKLTLKAGAGLASHGLTTLFSSDEEKARQWRQFLETRAQDMTAKMGELKGSVMKAGQLVSMYGEYFLPPEANKWLKTLQSQSPPVAWSQIFEILQRELGPEKMAQLEIDENAIGTASLGQVHRARRKENGQDLALKVQYPGVAKAIDSDLRALRSFLSLAKVIPQEFLSDSLFAEVRSMLEQETDYRLEASRTRDYGERLAQDPRFVVPKVVDDLCSAQVVATTFEVGIRPDDPRVASLPAQRRNQLALHFLDLYFKELFEWGVVQTDPHLGNYQIRLDEDLNRHLKPQCDDRLVLFDFGAVREYEPAFLEPYRRMVKAAVLHDLSGLERAAADLRFIREGDSPELQELFKNFCLLSVEPFQGGEYDWGRSDLPQRLTQMGFEMMKKFKLRSPPRELVFLDRKTGGVFIFLAVLKAKINGRAILDKYI